MEKANSNKNAVSSDGHRYVFGEFEIDPGNRRCLRGGNEVPLTSRVFDILLVFAENPGRLLGKDELIEKVWQGDFVEDGNLTRNVSTLRRALGDGAKEPRYIVTVQGYGYRFLADVVEISNGTQSGCAGNCTTFPGWEDSNAGRSNSFFKEVAFGNSDRRVINSFRVDLYSTIPCGGWPNQISGGPPAQITRLKRKVSGGRNSRCSH